jgi:hypothetical protein
MQSGILCILVDALIKLEIYSDYVQVCMHWHSSNFDFFGYGEHLFFLKKMWDNLRCGELQEHLAPSGYLKIPTVSITRNAPFMLFG